MAPPSTPATPMRASRSVTGTVAAYHATPPSAISATHDSTSVFIGKSTAFSMPNAAPVLCTRVRSRNPGITVDAFVQREGGAHHRLGDLIEDDDDDGHDDFELARGEHVRGSPALQAPRRNAGTDPQC